MLGNRRTFLVSAAAAVCASRRFLRAAEPVPPAWLAEAQRGPAISSVARPRLAPLLLNERGDSITSLSAWKTRREELRRWWISFLHPFAPHRGAAPKLEVLGEEPVGEIVRQLVRYETEPGVATEAYLMKPAKITGRLPGVAVFHSTVDFSIRQPAGLAGEPTLYFGVEFAQRNTITISPRNFLWPETGRIRAPEEAARFLKSYPQSRGMAKMLHDSQVALDILAAHPQVDSARLGAVGHSLGAKEVLYLAAFDERVKCAVSSEGGIGTKFSNWEAPWYLGEAVKHESFTHEHHELLALAAPRAFLLVGGDSADGDRSWSFIEAALPVYRLFGDRPPLGLLNHKQGHKLPVETARQVYEWFAAYL